MDMFFQSSPYSPLQNSHKTTELQTDDKSHCRCALHLHSWYSLSAAAKCAYRSSEKAPMFGDADQNALFLMHIALFILTLNCLNCKGFSTDKVIQVTTYMYVYLPNYTKMYCFLIRVNVRGGLSAAIAPLNFLRTLKISSLSLNIFF